jgi:hypothetical protein
VAMYLKFGSWQSDDYEATVSVSRENLTNAFGDPYACRHTWRLNGQKQAADTAALMTALQALETAFDGKQLDRDLTLESAGTVLHRLTQQGSFTGIRVVSPVSYPVGEGAQLSTFRDWTVTVSADYALGTGRDVLVSFQETVSYSGGGPVRGVVECVNVEPQEQILRKYSASRAVQSGSAVGLFDYPTVPAPLLGSDKLEFAPQISWGSPKRHGGQFTEFPVSWVYTFVSARPLSGFATQPPAGN